MHREVHAIDLGRRQEGLAHGLRLLEQVERVVVGTHDRELVAADAREQDLGRQRVAHAQRDELEQGVAGAVPEGVVDLLEAVEVEQHQSERTLLLDAVVQGAQHGSAVGQSREVVGLRELEGLARLS